MHRLVVRAGASHDFIDGRLALARGCELLESGFGMLRSAALALEEIGEGKHADQARSA